MKIFRNTYALFLMMFSLKFFKPHRAFKNKRVAIVGAADSAFKEKNGEYIDGFDVVVRLNKAPHSWTKEKAEFIGTKFTLLYHSFYENAFSGGGPIDWEYYKKLGIQKIVNPNYTKKGLQTQFSYYKRHLRLKNTYLLSRKSYKYVSKPLEGWVPTVGYTALASVLQCRCKEVYITGFTFFKTPYAKGYRKDLEDISANKLHIKKQGLHNPELEFESFKDALKMSRAKKVVLDKTLRELIEKE